MDQRPSIDFTSSVALILSLFAAVMALVAYTRTTEIDLLQEKQNEILKEACLRCSVQDVEQDEIGSSKDSQLLEKALKKIRESKDR